MTSEICTMCGKSRRAPLSKDERIFDVTGATASAAGGYLSPVIPDGSLWSIDLCEWCFVAIAARSQQKTDPSFSDYTTDQEQHPDRFGADHSILRAIREGRPDRLFSTRRKNAWMEMRRRAPDLVPDLGEVPKEGRTCLNFDAMSRFKSATISLLRIRAFFRTSENLLWMGNQEESPRYALKEEGDSIIAQIEFQNKALRWIPWSPSEEPEYTKKMNSPHPWWNVRLLEAFGIESHATDGAISGPVYEAHTSIRSEKLQEKARGETNQTTVFQIFDKEEAARNAAKNLLELFHTDRRENGICCTEALVSPCEHKRYMVEAAVEAYSLYAPSAYLRSAGSIVAARNRYMQDAQYTLRAKIRSVLDLGYQESSVENPPGAQAPQR